MKKNNLYVSIILLTFYNIIFAFVGTAQVPKPNIKLNVEQLSLTKWNTPDGVPYAQVPGANLGTIAFEVLANYQIGFLSSPTSEIIIINTADGKFARKFPVAYAPRDFIYENGFFFVLSEYSINVYDNTGKEINVFPIPKSYTAIERLARFNNATYLLLPSGNSAKVESGGQVIEPKEFSGWITRRGDLVETQISGNNSYSFKITGSDNKSFEKTIFADKKVAGVYVVGTTQNRVVLDVQTFISQNPVAVERHIVVVSLSSNGLGPVIFNNKVPDCYYTFCNRDFSLSADGKIYNMITAPEGVFVFSLAESNSGVINKYPESVSAINYHYNYHLIQVDAK